MYSPPNDRFVNFPGYGNALDEGIVGFDGNLFNVPPNQRNGSSTARLAPTDVTFQAQNPEISSGQAWPWGQQSVFASNDLREALFAKHCTFLGQRPVPYQHPFTQWDTSAKESAWETTLRVKRKKRNTSSSASFWNENCFECLCESSCSVSVLDSHTKLLRFFQNPKTKFLVTFTVLQDWNGVMIVTLRKNAFSFLGFPWSASQFQVFQDVWEPCWGNTSVRKSKPESRGNWTCRHKTPHWTFCSAPYTDLRSLFTPLMLC